MPYAGDQTASWSLCNLQVSPELGNHYSDVLAAQDIALYGGLCALASFDRTEIKRNVVESIGFREMLELNPEVGSQPPKPIASLCFRRQMMLPRGTLPCRLASAQMPQGDAQA